MGIFLLLVLWIVNFPCHAAFSQDLPIDIPDNIRVLLDTLQPLDYEIGDRELLYQYSVGDLNDLSTKDAARVIQKLARRGVGVITFWKKGELFESQIQEGIRIARIQDSLGLSVAVDATRLLYDFYDGTPATAHRDADGNAFFDSSFADRPMGCPFTLQARVPVIRSRITAYEEAYHQAGTPIDIVTADWEIDGPHEWNRAWVNSKRCIRCRNHIPNITDFRAFQAAIRSLRSRLLRICYTSPILRHFPDALITNYATYPNDGWRYWYDYFESPQPKLPHRRDQGALYRPWYDEFTETGFTMAMPVVYTWYPTFNWYPEYSPDYRWFYNMLLVGSNAGQSTPSGIPIATFVHWHTTAPPSNPDPAVQQMSQQAYQELLWHLLLRGHDMLFSWCRQDELATEMRLLQDVYNESLRYNAFITSGRPVSFEVPKQEGSIISGLKLDNELLIRRTDFAGDTEPVTLTLDSTQIVIPSKPAGCQVIRVE